MGRIMASVLRKCECDTPKCGHPWTVRYREPGGRTARQREKTFPRKREADAFAAKMESEKNRGVYLDPSRGSITVRAWSEEWLSNQPLAPGTRRNYSGFFRIYLVPELGNKTIAGVMTSDIQRLITVMSKTLSPLTIRTRMIPLRALFAAAVKDKRIPSNPCNGVTLPKSASQAVDRDSIPTLPEIRSIVAAMPERLQTAVWLMAGAGLRLSEVLAVSEDCIRGETLRVYQQVSSENPDGSQAVCLAPLKHRAQGEYREMPLPKFLSEAIRDHIAEHGTTDLPVQSGLLFTSDRRGASPTLLTSAGFRWHWSRATQTYTPHDLRHFYASTALAGGVSLVEVSRWLGHSSIAITADTYGHLTVDAPERMRNVMEDALRPPLRVVQSA